MSQEYYDLDIALEIKYEISGFEHIDGSLFCDNGYDSKEKKIYRKDTTVIVPLSKIFVQSDFDMADNVKDLNSDKMRTLGKKSKYCSNYSNCGCSIGYEIASARLVKNNRLYKQLDKENVQKTTYQ